MMNIYNKIEKTRFTDVENQFIQYITTHQQEIIDMNVSQLAKASYVSLSTIYRVMEKLDLSGINELKLKLANDKNSYIEVMKDVDYNYPFHKHNTHHQIMTKMLSLYDQTLKSTFNLIDLDTFLKVEQALYNANNIIIFPSIGNYFIAESFQQNMLEIGVKVDVVVERFYQMWNVNACHKGDIVILISYANRTPHFTELAKSLKEKEIKTILISSTKITELTDLVDLHLYFSSYEDSKEKIASFSSRLSLLYLLDCLYACYFNRDYEKNLQHNKHYID